MSSYTDADSQATTSTYDIDGNIKTVNDGKGAYTYGYDGTDANGKTEHRGLVTSLDVGISGSPSTFAAGYDQDGNLTVENYPGGVQQLDRFDNTDNQFWMTYAKSGTNWMTFGSGSDRDGRTVWQGSPGSSQSFGYDNNGRLTSVQDTVSGQCTTRAYTFSRNGNRTALATGAPSADGSCQTSATTTTSTSYDAADRDTNTGYTYDKFGRTLTVPTSDVSGGSALNLGYYSNDMVASQTQGAKTKAFTLDPAMRLRTATDTTSGTENRRILNHYNDSADTPSWINTSTDAGTTWTWQRNVAGIDGNLAILQSSTGTPQIQLTNPHGDVVATTDDAVAATSTNAYFESTEYGIPRTSNASNPLRYEWLGAKQRSDDDLGGLALMGVRLFNPNTGRFLSQDPITGGNENDYAYPNNPIDYDDIDGTLLHFLTKHAGAIATIGINGLCTVASGGACLVAGALYTSAHMAYNIDHYGLGSKTLVDAAWDIGATYTGGGAGAGAAKAMARRAAKKEARAAGRKVIQTRATRTAIRKALTRGPVRYKAGRLARRATAANAAVNLVLATAGMKAQSVTAAVRKAL